tara:strand:- start:1572 stop:1973 length:402 start_codon:yes stop_codon:yes gene_type:complete
MKYLLILFIQIISFHFISQNYVASFDSIQPEKNYENIYVKKLSSDISATTFAIWVKKSVRIHKHIQHVENVYIREGSGDFQLGDSTYKVKSGDLIIIPKNTWHGVVVKSKEPMKVISIQSPEFVGNDRIFKDN